MKASGVCADLAVQEHSMTAESFIAGIVLVLALALVGGVALALFNKK